MSNVLVSASSGANETERMRAGAEYRTIDLRRFLLLFWRRRYMVLALGLTGLALGIGLSFVVAPRYDAVVRLMPPTPRETTLSSLVSGRGGGDFSLGLLNSRTVADDVIARQHLADYFHVTKPTKLRELLAEMARVGVGPDQFVTVTVRAQEPETALRIANEYPAALYRLNHELALSEADHRWESFRAPLEQERSKLADAEEDLKRAEQKTGVVLPEAQLRIGIGAAADLRQQIGARQAQLAGLQTSSTEQNPQVIELKSQIASLSGQMRRLEEQTGGAGTNAANAQLPELTLQVARRQREVKFHETLFDVLSRQYENARFEESYSPQVELVDKAVLPDQKAWPTHRTFAITGFACGLLLAMVIITFRGLEVRRRWQEFVTSDDANGVQPENA